MKKSPVETNKLVNLFERVADRSTPEQALMCAVITQAVRDAAYRIKACKEEVSGTRREQSALAAISIREDARRFFFMGGYIPFAEWCGLEPDFVKRVLVQYTIWAREEYFAN